MKFKKLLLMFSFVALLSSLRFYDFSLFQTIYAEEKDNVTELNTLNNIGIIKGKRIIIYKQY